MGGIAFVFSGQGDQHPGMGQALAQTYGAAAEVFACCDHLRPGTSAQCFAEPEVTYVNDQMLRILRIPPETDGQSQTLAFYRDNILRSIPGEERPHFLELLRRVREGEGPVTGELTVLRGDGTRARLYGWITKNMTAREETEIQSVCVDVTERFETERARRIDRYMQALTEVYDKIFEYDFAADTVKCLYGKNSEVFKWVQDIPMQLAEATEKWIRKTVVEADQNRVLAFFRHFYRPENRGDGTVPVQIRYDAFSSDGTVRAYTGVFLQIDTQTSFFCCRRAVSDPAAGLLAEETAALRSLQETLPEMVLRMTDGIVAFEVENDTVRPLYVSDNICDFFGYTKNEWISMTRQRQSIRSFVSRSNVRYEEFMALFQNGEAEFEYMDRRTQCARWICIRVLKKTNELDLFDVFSDRHSAYYEAKLYGGACHGIFLQETSEMASSSCRVHSWRCRFLFDRCGAGCAGFQYQPAASHLLCAEGQPCHFSFL